MFSSDKLLTVNGVVFVMDRQGKKLVRQDVMLADTVKSTIAQSGRPSKKQAMNSSSRLVPKQVMIGDQAYVRTKRGNLVRAA